MPETDAFRSFTIRAEPGRPPWAILYPARDGDAAASAPSEGEALDEAALRLRIASLRREGRDTSVADAALAALLRAARAQKGLVEEAAPAAAPSSSPWRAAPLAAAVEASAEAVMLATAGEPRRIVYANPAFGRLLGQRPEALLGLNPATLLPEAEPSAGSWRRVLLPGRQGAGTVAEAIRLPLPAGPGASGEGYVAWILHPVAVAPDALDERDPVTGLPVLATVMAALESALAATPLPGRGPCAVWLRVERLEELTAVHGPAVRDALLLGVADRLMANLRRADLVARDGEDAFILSLPRVALPDARSIVARLRAAVAAAPVETPIGPLRVRLRCGIATPPAETAAELVQAARREALAERVPADGD